MKFDIDVLIIFAEKDNDANAGPAMAWVSQFKKFLELMLTQVSGEKPNILMKGEHDNLTSPNLDNAATLVTIMSTEFNQSGECLDHLESFYKAIEQSTKSRNRVFKVFKAPLSNQEQPPRLRELLGYEMYHLDTDSGEIREYTDYFSSQAERQYWMKMVDLAFDIADALVYLKNGEQPAVKNFFQRKTIYLAETSHDLSVQRNIIRRELTRHGYEVLPNQSLPGNAHDLEALVKKNLEESHLSIHLIGTAYGEIPSGSEKSSVDIQNVLAAQKSLGAKEKGDEFTRLIWVSPNLSNASEKQLAFIDTLKRDAEVQEGAEILQTPLEDFKNIMREELMEIRERKKSDEDDEKSVYLMHDKIDQQAVRPIIQAIERSGYKVMLPIFEGELLELRKHHIENLKNLDAAIIFKGSVNEQWVRMKALDLLKAPGFGRKKPIIGKAIFTDSDTNSESYLQQKINVYKSGSDQYAESIKNFMADLSN